MGRKVKQTIDYFPHNCRHGKTIYILEQHYQSRGYSFWFKLLEELGSHNGHFLDLKDESEIQFLCAKTWFKEEEMIEVLDLLSKIKAIDSDLWQNKIVWSDNFVDNIKDVYSKRTISVPEKPISDSGNNNSNNGKRQSKVNESKVKKSSSRFTPPTLEDLKKYIKEKKFTTIDPEYFINFYESKNWMVGKNKMTSWKASASGWESRSRKENPVVGEKTLEQKKSDEKFFEEKGFYPPVGY